MTAPIAHTIQGQVFWLSPDRTVFWEKEKTLIVSDLHFGKTGHFRKSGIAVPQSLFREDLQRLIYQISCFKPSRIIAVGDLFHSEANKELDLFLKWRQDFSTVDFMLVKGNHDILREEWYEQAGITVHKGLYMINRMGFIHDPEEINSVTSGTDYIFSGHLHPGVCIKGTGRQSLSFPCFYFSNTLAILPAFSRFSGLAMIEQKKTDQVYAIVNQSLVKVT